MEILRFLAFGVLATASCIGAPRPIGDYNGVYECNQVDRMVMKPFGIAMVPENFRFIKVKVALTAVGNNGIKLSWAEKGKKYEVVRKGFKPSGEKLFYTPSGKNSYSDKERIDLSTMVDTPFLHFHVHTSKNESVGGSACKRN